MSDAKNFLDIIDELIQRTESNVEAVKTEISQQTRLLTYNDQLVDDDMLRQLPDETLELVLTKEELARLREGAQETVENLEETETSLETGEFDDLIAEIPNEDEEIPDFDEPDQELVETTVVVDESSSNRSWVLPAIIFIVILIAIYYIFVN